jgi:hypothetical protein
MIRRAAWAVESRKFAGGGENRTGERLKSHIMVRAMSGSFSATAGDRGSATSNGLVSAE